MEKSTPLLLAIVILGFILRIWNISNLPPALYSDEVDIGYQAQVFNKHQTDYFNNWLPVHFHSFSDWQPGIGIYVISLFEKIMKNQELAVRLPSAIFGSLSIVIVYLITRSTIPSFLLAISPWAIHFSRIGFAASGLIFILLTGIYFWQKYLNTNKVVYLYFSIASFVLSPYIYSTAKLFLIFISLLLLLIWRKELLTKRLTDFIIPILFGLILLIPMGIDTIQGKSGYRFSYISIFTEPHREQIVDVMRYQDTLIDHPNELGIAPSLTSKITHNKYQIILKKFVNNYLSAFSTDFLFLKGDSNYRHGFGNFGLMYIIDILCIFLGLFYTLSNYKNNRISHLFLWLLVLSPIPFALTRDSNSPNATRLILMLPSLIYFAHLGIKYLYIKRRLFSFAIIIIYLISFLDFWHYYQFHYPNESAGVWDFGIKESILLTNKYPDKNLVFSNFYESSLPFFLFYHPYQLDKRDSIVNHLDQINNQSLVGQVLDHKYYFGRLNWDNLTDLPTNSLIIIPEMENNQVPKNLQMIGYTDKPYVMAQRFYIYSVNEK